MKTVLVWPLETVVMCFIWIASNDGLKLEVSVPCVTKNGISLKLNEYQATEMLQPKQRKLEEYQ